MRQEIQLDGLWRFAAFEEGLGERQGAHQSAYDASGWLDACVPGDVHADLRRAGLIPDPHCHHEADDCRWVEQKEWWYRTEFTVPPEFPRENARLVFDGLDTHATVWLNGTELGRAADERSPHSVEVGPLLTVGPNAVAARFDPNAASGIRRSVRLVSSG